MKSDNYILNNFSFVKFIRIILSKTNGKIFQFIFNFFSLIKKSPNRIYFKKNYFYNTEVDWRFGSIDRMRGWLHYKNGFKKRKNQLISEYLIKDLEFKDNDVILDIGANNGDFYLCFDKKIKYYAYEPSPEIYSSLEYNIKNQNLYNLALSNTSGSTNFYLSDEFGDSSILPINNFTKKIIIKTKTLDEEIDRIQLKIKLIKLEAEGFEPEILQGLKKHLNSVEYITIDCGFERGTKNESTIAECSNYLIRNNFKMINYGKSRIVTLFKKL